MSSDPGASGGRTALSGQRTALAVAAGSAVVARLGVDRLGPWALVVLVVNLPLSGWVLLDSRARYLRWARGDARRSGATASAALALAVAVLALVELLAVLHAP